MHTSLSFLSPILLFHSFSIKKNLYFEIDDLDFLRDKLLTQIGIYNPGKLLVTDI